MSATTRCRDLTEPGVASVIPIPMAIEHVDPRRRQLDDAEVLAGAMVDVHVEAGLLE